MGRRYVQYFNYTHMRTRTLWESRYRSTVIDTEAYLLACMRYFELNLVRAKDLVQHPAAYPWSSYRGNAQGADDRLLTAQEVYRRLAGHATAAGSTACG